MRREICCNALFYRQATYNNDKFGVGYSMNEDVNAQINGVIR